MTIDASIYNNIRPVETPSPLDSMQRAMNISSLAMQNKHASNQIAREQDEQNRADQQRKLIAVGGAVEKIVNLPKDQWESAFNAEQDNLIKSGMMNDKDRLPYSDNTLGSLYYRLNNNPDWLKIKQAQAEIAATNAKAKSDPLDRDLERQVKKSQIAKNYADVRKGDKEASGKLLPAESATKIGNLLGAINASGKIESTGSVIPTGKIEAAKDWFKSNFDSQDQGRANSLADIANQRNQIMSQIAGANVTPDEKSRILEGIPTNTDSKESFAGKGRSTTDQIIGKAQAEIDALEASGYNVSELRSRLARQKSEIDLFRRDYDKRTQTKKGSSGLVPNVDAAPPEVPMSFEEWKASKKGKN